MWFAELVFFQDENLPHFANLFFRVNLEIPDYEV